MRTSKRHEVRAFDRDLVRLIVKTKNNPISMAKMAERLDSCSEKTVYRAITRLVKLGILDVIWGGGPAPYEYAVNFDKISPDFAEELKSIIPEKPKLRLKEEEILRAIARYADYPMLYTEMAGEVGLSVGGLRNAIKRLESKGFIKKRPDSYRGTVDYTVNYGQLDKHFADQLKKLRPRGIVNYSSAAQ